MFSSEVKQTDALMKDHEFREKVETLGIKNRSELPRSGEELPSRGEVHLRNLKCQGGCFKLPLVVLTNQSITFLTGWAKLLKNEHCIIKHERCQSQVMNIIPHPVN